MSNQGMETKVAEWLDKQGYPVEMTVARGFQGSDFRVHQSYYFIDPSTSKSREVDILVTKQVDIDGRHIRAVFVIECKKSVDKPWVVFTSPTSLPKHSQVVHRPTTPLGGTLLEAFHTDLASSGLFSFPNQSGYAVTTAFGDKDRAYAAVHSVASATECLVSLLTPTTTSAVFFPIVIFEGCLFSCRLDENGETVITEEDSAVLVLRKTIGRAPHTVVRILTLNGLDDFVGLVGQTCEALFQLDASRVASTLGRPSTGGNPDNPATDF